MCFRVYSDRCTYVCADPECAMERRHPRSFSPDWVEWPRRCTVPYPANLETRLEIPIFNGVSTIPSTRVESSRGTFPRKFSLIKLLTRFHYVLLFIFSLFFPSFYSLCVYEILKIIINPISKILLRFLYASNGALNSLDLFSSLRVATFIVM